MKHHSSRLGRKEGIAGLLLVTPQIIYFLVFFLPRLSSESRR